MSFIWTIKGSISTYSYCPSHSLLQPLLVLCLCCITSVTGQTAPVTSHLRENTAFTPRFLQLPLHPLFLLQQDLRGESQGSPLSSSSPLILFSPFLIWLPSSLREPCLLMPWPVTPWWKPSGCSVLILLDFPATLDKENHLILLKFLAASPHLYPSSQTICSQSFLLALCLLFHN